MVDVVLWWCIWLGVVWIVFIGFVGCLDSGLLFCIIGWVNVWWEKCLDFYWIDCCWRCNVCNCLGLKIIVCKYFGEIGWIWCWRGIRCGSELFIFKFLGKRIEGCFVCGMVCVFLDVFSYELVFFFFVVWVWVLWCFYWVLYWFEWCWDYLYVWCYWLVFVGSDDWCDCVCFD